MTDLPKILCLMGPTGSGKTALAVEWVQHNPSEIISVDSAMIYRGMDVGTAKPSAEILALAPHRLIDICKPNEQYSAANFRHDALQAIEEIIAAGRTPLLVGGTMLYFRALQFGLSKLPQADATIRDELSAKAQKIGWSAMHAKLQTVDPESAKRINPNDPQRIQRALEIYELTGKTRTQLWQATQAEPLPYQFINLAITIDRAVLHQRIEQRFAAMLADGLVTEVEALMARGDLTLQLPAMRAVGYRQVWQYLIGEFTYDEMQQRAIFATRQLAKRQLTWLRHWQEIKWLAPKNKNALADILREF